VDASGFLIVDDDTKSAFDRLEGMIRAFVEESHARDRGLADKDVSTASALRTIEARVTDLEQRPRVGDERTAIVTSEGSRPVREIRIIYEDDEAPK
jgi:hypothetical protein